MVQVQYCKKAYIASRERRSTTTDIPNKIVRVTHTGRPLLGFHYKSSRYPGFSFGDKTITLSTSEVVTVPNVIRMLIPESIVKQYLAYAEESNFTPLSRRTLLKVLSVCAASTRKTLQGLDYIRSAGAQAFEDLTDVAKRLQRSPNGNDLG